MHPFTDTHLQLIQDRCATRDRLYTRRFWETDFYHILEPLLHSFNSDWGVPKQIDILSESLPETTATVGLMLYRLRLINQVILRHIQDYLWSTHYYLSTVLKSKQLYEINTTDIDRMSLDEACWSTEGRNVWTTAICIWTLVASEYNGPLTFLYTSALNWLLLQQNESGSWGFTRDPGNPSSIFLTAITAYTLRLCLQKLSSLSNDQKQKLQKSINDALNFIRRSRNTRTNLWPTHEHVKESEPTASTMALWTLHFCGTSAEREVIDRGVTALRHLLASDDCWHTYEIATGKIPDSGLSMELQGYTPALPLALLQIGVSPDDTMIMRPVEFLRKNKQASGWDFPIFSRIPGRYVKSLYYVGTGEALTFTTALVIQMVEVWHKRLLMNSLSRNQRRRHPALFPR